MRRVLIGCCGLLWAVGCTSDRDTPAPTPHVETPSPSACPDAPIHVTQAPDVDPTHREAAFWLNKLGPAADEVVLDDAAITSLVEAALELDGAYRDVLSDEVGDQQRVSRELNDRGRWIQKRIDSGDYVEAHPGGFTPARAMALTAPEIDELHVIAAESQVHCVPMLEGIFSSTSGTAKADEWDTAFDRNYCSSLHPGELVRALRRSEDGAWFHVHAGHSVGWLYQPAWTPPLPRELAASFRDARPRLAVLRDDLRSDAARLRIGTSFPVVKESADAWVIRTPRPTGLDEASVPKQPGASTDPLPFTRRNVFELALAQLDAPYGWGGHAGGRDCSRFLYDQFYTFGLRLGRHSSVQAQLGSESVDLGGLDDAAKREQIRRAAGRGIVLLYMPGHIMLYLGQDGGRDYAVSSLSEYLVPCAGGDDTVYRLDRVAVTTLEVGRGTQRKAFIERINRMAVFGGTPASPLSEP